MGGGGAPKYKAIGWFGLLAPATTPIGIVTKLRATLAEAAKSPEVIAGLRVQGIEPASSGPSEFAAFIREQPDPHKNLVGDADLQLAQQTRRPAPIVTARAGSHHMAD